MTFNVHQLLHLAKSVESLGPLWAHSTFVFESGNGKIVKSVTASKGVPDQIIERIAMRQELELALAHVNIPNPTIHLCECMLGYEKVRTTTRSDGACMLGKPKAAPLLSQVEQHALEAYGIDPCCRMMEYFRFIQAGTVFHSHMYFRAQKSDCTVFTASAGEAYTIHRILKVSLGHLSKCVLLCQKIVHIEEGAQFPPHIKECFVSPANNFVVLLPSDIFQPSVLMVFGFEDRSFISQVPNMVERD